MQAETAYLFRHALLRDGAYQLHLPGDRARLHGLALDIIEQLFKDNPSALDAASGDLADHALSAAQGGDDAARNEYLRRELHWLERAVAVSERSGRQEDVVAYGKRVAVHPLAGLPTRVTAMLAVSKGLEWILDYHGAVETARHCAAMAEQTGDAVLRVRALTDLSRRLKSIDRYAEADRALTMAIESARAAGDAEGLARALVCQVEGMLRFGAIPKTEAFVAELEELEPRIEDPATLGAVKVLRCRLRLLHSGSELPQVAKHVEETLAWLAERGLTSLLVNLHFNLGIAWANRGTADRALVHYGEAARLAEKVGMRTLRHSLQVNLANVQYYMQARLLDALENYNGAHDAALELGLPSLRFYALTHRATLFKTLGRFEQADADGQVAYELGKQLGSPNIELSNLSLLTELRWLQQRDSEAAPLALEYLALSRTKGDEGDIASALRVFADLAAGSGRLNAARRALAESLAHAESLDWPTYQMSSSVRLHLLLLLFGERHEAEPFRLQAARHFAKSEMVINIVSYVAAPAFRDCAYRFAMELGPPSREALSEVEKAATAVFEARCQNDQRLMFTTQRYLNEVEGVRAEFRRAYAAGEPPLLFMGFVPASLPPLQRAALLERLKAIHPDVYEQLRTRNPRVLELMAQGTEGLAVPDWRDETLP